MNNVSRHNGVPSQTKDHKTASLRCMFMSCSSCSFYFLRSTPQTYSAFVPTRFFTLNPSHLSPALSLHSNSISPFPFMSPGAQAQQAFRSEPRNLTVRMGATAVLRCEVLRASGTVQWAKDGLLLGPQRSLPGFPHYSMIGNPKRGKPGNSRNKVYGLLGFDGLI